jgi:hypothetical protein
MSAFASYASPLTSSNTILPPVNTTGTGGSTYKYESASIHGGRNSRRRKCKCGGKSQKNKKRGGKTHNKKSRKSHKKH